MKVHLASPIETEALGARLALQSKIAWKTLALQGDLGAGKTTLVRGMVHALGGNPGDVHSPSYVLEHHYDVNGGVLLHRDAWRGDAGESDTACPECLCLVVEWPERACEEWWPQPALVVTLEHSPSGRTAFLPDGVL
ncbi:MAG: tRNA (adenosine(37)-N6)-threonylcarbamoyltransferase complex ATPase subunit type 1 TsaE [Phycisphaerae bacterium]|nr:tRNA (adenosine(37)-N6)-threonylcarbamoyltransferase complex ATPase subunit type 1 TsaE [Phycisphaerae bacterium]